MICSCFPLEIRYFCPNNCGRSYKHRRHLSRHKNFECGQEPRFHCSVDGCTFRTHDKRTWKVHTVTKHIKKEYNRYFCPNYCGRSYKHKKHLTQHVRYECGREPRFLCSALGCEFRTHYKRNWKFHIVNRHPESNTFQNLDFPVKSEWK